MPAISGGIVFSHRNIQLCGCSVDLCITGYLSVDLYNSVKLYIAKGWFADAFTIFCVGDMTYRDEVYRCNM